MHLEPRCTCECKCERLATRGRGNSLKHSGVCDMCYSRLCAMWTQSPQEWTHSYLHISEGHYAAIHNHAVRDYFNLCCGVLLGQFLDKGWSHRVTAIVPCTNVHPEPTQRFRIALEQLAQIGRETDGSNEEIVGVYFSYPDGSEYTQSVLDTYQLWGMAYVAVRIASDSSTNEMTSWKLIGPENAKRFQRQTIIIAKTREQVQDRAAALATSEPPATSVPPGSGLDKLNALIGLPKLKDEVRRMVASVKVQQARKKHGMKTHQSSLHMVFTGNPGTGKTTVARLIAEIYGEIGVLSKGHLVETDRAGLVGQWVGSTALKTVEIVNAAIGGILFIDEAYSLMPAGHGHDFAAEAIATLLKLMEDYRDDLVVIIAGYPNEMQKFIDTNPGLASRFAKHLHFEDYTTKDLLKIFVKFCEDSDYDVDPDDWDSMRRKVEQVFEGERRGNTTNFANGRFVRNVFEHTIARQAVRIANGDLSRIIAHKSPIHQAG